jgi:hypothetical protein
MTLQQQSINAAIVVDLNYWCGNIIAEKRGKMAILSKFTSYTAEKCIDSF